MSIALDPSKRRVLATSEETVLVVDDDPGFRSIVVGRLKKAGAYVHEVASVVEAINVLEREHVDLVVCDYKMPEAYGTSLLAYLTCRGFPGRFVLMSASLPPEAAAEARGQGADAIEKWDLLNLL
jgi:CheY-like chemotaxis protein